MEELKQDPAIANRACKGWGIGLETEKEQAVVEAEFLGTGGVSL
jgi:hypothetical protein